MDTALQTVDVVICTYNRQVLVNSLVDDLKKYLDEIKEIVVVDSSDAENELLKNDATVTLIKSPRKSQPFQRQLGAEYCTSEIVVFFDDDVKITRNDLFKNIKEAFINNEIVGVSAGIHYENGVEMNQQSASQVKAYTGQISWLGRASGLPKTNTFVDYFPGPIMSFRRSLLDKLFDEYLFSIFEKRVAMGEDKVISMRASVFGKLYFLGEKMYLHHPPEPSTYFNNEKDFVAKTVFSRLWLSKEYAKAHNKPLALAYFYFFLYFAKNYILSIFTFNWTRISGMNKSLAYLFKY